MKKRKLIVIAIVLVVVLFVGAAGIDLVLLFHQHNKYSRAVFDHAFGSATLVDGICEDTSYPRFGVTEDGYLTWGKKDSNTGEKYTTFGKLQPFRLNKFNFDDRFHHSYFPRKYLEPQNLRGENIMAWKTTTDNGIPIYILLQEDGFYYAFIGYNGYGNQLVTSYMLFDLGDADIFFSKYTQ